MASEIAGGKDITRSIDTNVCYFSMFSDDIKTSGSPKTGYFLILSPIHSLLDRVRFFYNFNWFYSSIIAPVHFDFNYTGRVNLS